MLWKLLLLMGAAAGIAALFVEDHVVQAMLGMLAVVLFGAAYSFRPRRSSSRINELVRLLFWP